MRENPFPPGLFCGNATILLTTPRCVRNTTIYRRLHCIHLPGLDAICITTKVRPAQMCSPCQWPSTHPYCARVGAAAGRITTLARGDMPTPYTSTASRPPARPRAPWPVAHRLCWIGARLGRGAHATDAFSTLPFVIFALLFGFTVLGLMIAGRVGAL